MWSAASVLPSPASSVASPHRLLRSSGSRLGAESSKCWMITKASSVSSGSAEQNDRSASSPPEDAPIPTTSVGAGGATPSERSGSSVDAYDIGPPRDHFATGLVNPLLLPSALQTIAAMCRQSQRLVRVDRIDRLVNDVSATPGIAENDPAIACLLPVVAASSSGIAALLSKSLYPRGCP